MPPWPNRTVRPQHTRKTGVVTVRSKPRGAASQGTFVRLLHSRSSGGPRPCCRQHRRCWSGAVHAAGLQWGRATAAADVRERDRPIRHYKRRRAVAEGGGDRADKLVRAEDGSGGSVDNVAVRRLGVSAWQVRLHERSAGQVAAAWEGAGTAPVKPAREAAVTHHPGREHVPHCTAPRRLHLHSRAAPRGEVGEPQACHTDRRSD